MNANLIVAIAMLAVWLPAGAWAQSTATSLYRGQETREIKSLSAQDVKDLETGSGMGLAKAAELNRYPGPAHVLQLAQPLELSAAQRASVQTVFDRMQAQAVAVGRRILELEGELDRAFAQQAITTERLQQTVAEIARLQGDLRTVHLRAHLEMLPLLSRHQVRQYVALRGYEDGSVAPQHGMGGAARH